MDGRGGDYRVHSVPFHIKQQPRKNMYNASMISVPMGVLIQEKCFQVDSRSHSMVWYCFGGRCTHSRAWRSRWTI